ncbi:hypothetical protein SAMN06265375_101739 [Muriicola jejuensis]|uniref:Uncharacterized protein n=1 Tax=Muriicola jejuensis TaxID=504488 RepID=A0A6P0U955_9FLAO|nr:hypothetical protein [Muriicola jejuensis]NER09745.1 hypothetical protein [Muriicola jejuensis]SMP06094.1 hypothetical protein SAMN06265375_101739 [Muriicola jejuensis]
MFFKSKYFITAIVLSSLGAIVYGFIVLEEQPSLGNKCIGFGTVGLFLLAMPLFLLRESKGKNVKDYMLTEDNIRKMREIEEKKSRKDSPSTK